jgi:hypothetical protein
MRSRGIILLVLAAACQQTRTDAAASSRAMGRAPDASVMHSDAHSALDELDARAPLPLLPMMANHQKQNMRDHLVAVQEILSAVAVDDFSTVERAAGRMGFSEPMAQMCTHMGAGATGFTERALDFHHTADTIAVAARAQDHAAVVAALGKTLSACTGCHAAFKQQVMDEATWRQVTGAASTAGHPR